MILLDTHALIWALRDPSKLSRSAADAIHESGESGGLAVSAMTLWELAWLAGNARLKFTGTIEAFVDRLSSRVAIRPITARIAVVAVQLPRTYPRDPIDRLIGATALVEEMALVTKDRSIRQHAQIKTIW